MGKRAVAPPNFGGRYVERLAMRAPCPTCGRPAVHEIASPIEVTIIHCYFRCAPRRSNTWVLNQDLRPKPGVLVPRRTLR